jgi:nucleotide-binding universal stress UspA family protein
LAFSAPFSVSGSNDVGTAVESGSPRITRCTQTAVRNTFSLDSSTPGQHTRTITSTRRTSRINGDLKPPMTSDPPSTENDPNALEPFGAGPRCIVVAVDGSPSAQRAASFAAGLARRNHASLIAVQVERPPRIWPDVGLTTTEYEPQPPQPAPAIVALLTEMAREVGIAVELIVREGAPAREIAALADERKADLVVAGASESLRRRLTRPVAARLARRRAWPVITVP